MKKGGGEEKLNGYTLLGKSERARGEGFGAIRRKKGKRRKAKGKS